MLLFLVSSKMQPFTMGVMLFITYYISYRVPLTSKTA